MLYIHFINFISSISNCQINFILDCQAVIYISCLKALLHFAYLFCTKHYRLMNWSSYVPDYLLLLTCGAQANICAVTVVWIVSCVFYEVYIIVNENRHWPQIAQIVSLLSVEFRVVKYADSSKMHCSKRWGLIVLFSMFCNNLQSIYQMSEFLFCTAPITPSKYVHESRSCACWILVTWP